MFIQASHRKGAECSLQFNLPAPGSRDSSEPKVPYKATEHHEGLHLSCAVEPVVGSAMIRTKDSSSRNGSGCSQTVLAMNWGSASQTGRRLASLRDLSEMLKPSLMRNGALVSVSS